jgi:hypothetical protein
LTIEQAEAKGGAEYWPKGSPNPAISTKERNAMIKFSCRNSLQPVLFATALPLALLAEGAGPAVAGSVSVTGANGRDTGLGTAGAGGSATATTTTPSDPSNTATATGGNGGSHCFGGAASGCFPGGAGGAGGAAGSTATTIRSGAASAEATSFGGNGGAGGPGEGGVPPGLGGNGGAASSSADASSTTGSATAAANSTGGRRGQGRPPSGAGGSASAGAAASSTGSGEVQANASAFSGQPGSSASASANAQNRRGEALTTASAAAAGAASALSKAAVGPGSSESLVAIAAGHAVSNAILTPNGLTQPGSVIDVGAMSAAYGGSGAAVTYEATATFAFSTPIEALDLKLLSDNSADTAGTSFDSLELLVIDGPTQIKKTFSSLAGSAGAETFFTAHPISLGALAAGKSIEIEYFLDYKSDTSAAVGNGFGFTYDLVDPPPSATIPEPSTWAMLIVGFAGLAFAGHRTRLGHAVVKKA